MAHTPTMLLQLFAVGCVTQVTGVLIGTRPGFGTGALVQARYPSVQGDTMSAFRIPVLAITLRRAGGPCDRRHDTGNPVVTYALDVRGGLYTIDRSTGAATFVAAVSFTVLHFGDSGTLYGASTALNTLYAIDKITGVETAVDPPEIVAYATVS